MKKNLRIITIFTATVLLLTACGNQNVQQSEETTKDMTEKINIEEATEIILSDESILVDGTEASEDKAEAVYKANDIVYYEEGYDFTYGEGTEEEAHTAEEAKTHTVVHITEPGMYAVSGKLSKGQIAIDLGEDAEENPEAVVTLVLNGVDINCDVAPAVIFYNVYECGSKEETDATKDVDTTKAGANVYIMNNTENTITGSHVAKIYESYVLNDDGTEIIDSKKLHKYDAAFYSKMTMNIDGSDNTSGVLNINADNEGLGTELHLTINEGNINIKSGNDGINTNEDGISVTTVDGGCINIHVTGETGEGDGIDSNGWLVINGGTVVAEACSNSADAGLDSDMGIHINGGTVYATGNMLDRVSESKQNYVVMSFVEHQEAGITYSLKNENEEDVITVTPGNDFSNLIMSDSSLLEGIYTFWKGETQLLGVKSEMTGGIDKPEDIEIPEGMKIPDKDMVKEEMKAPQVDGAPAKAQKGEMPDKLEGMKPPKGNVPGKDQYSQPDIELSEEFEITLENNYYRIY